MTKRQVTHPSSYSFGREKNEGGAQQRIRRVRNVSSRINVTPSSSIKDNLHVGVESKVKKSRIYDTDALFCAFRFHASTFPALKRPELSLFIAIGSFRDFASTQKSFAFLNHKLMLRHRSSI